MIPGQKHLVFEERQARCLWPGLVGDVVRAQARIKSLYRSRGVLVTGLDVYGSRRREEWQKQPCSSA